jgi:RNA polymerase sigma-70 factor (ECF subfamily)
MSLSWHGIRDHLMRTSSTFIFQRSFGTIRREHQPVARFRDPAALLDTLHRRDGDAEQKNRILGSLVRTAQAGRPAAECAITLMLLALWPGLDAIQRRSSRRKPGTSDEVASEILARATEAIVGLDLHKVSRIAATVVMNVERDMLRERKCEAGRQKAIVNADVNQIASVPDADDHPICPGMHGDLVQLIGADATLVMRVAVEGYSQIEAAAEMGLSEAAARKRYQRAKQRLRTAMQDFV